MLYLNTKIKLVFVAALLVAFSKSQGWAQQQKNELENEKQQLENAITFTNKLLDDTRKSKQTTLSELALLNNKIMKREKLVQNYRKEQTLLNDSIFVMLLQIEKSSDEISQLKDEYARMVYYAYKNENIYQRVAYVFAAEDFNQAYQRLSFYRQYTAKRKSQITLIENATVEYKKQLGLLNIKVNQNDSLLAILNNESELLVYEKNLKKGTISNLKKQENELVKNQENYQKKANELKKRIEQIIMEDIADAGMASGKGSTSEIKLTPAEEIVSSNFSSNQGRLPWPSERGVVSSGFGNQEHPDLKGIKIKNNGINIITQKGASARAVFDGEVTRVFTVPNFNNVVIIRHGDFLTVYSNLDEVFVKKGSQVKMKQELGTIFTNTDDFKTELHFEIWKSKTLLDPLIWLAIDKTTGLTIENNP